NDLEAARIFAANLFNNILRDGHGRKIEPIHVRLRGEAPRNISFGNEAILHQNVDDIGSAIEFGARFLDLCARHQPRVFEEIENVIFVWMHHRKLSCPHEIESRYSTVTLFARLRGLSTSRPKATAR